MPGSPEQLATDSGSTPAQAASRAGRADRAACPDSASASPPERIQPLDATSLRAVLAELRPELLPSRFEKAQQSDGQTLQLGLRGLHGSPWLELSWLAEAPRLLAIPPPPRQGEGSTLARQLQHGLRGLALVDLQQQGWERVVELAFARRPGEPPQRWLVLELMGRHSNLFLLDADRRVVALARQVRSGQSRLRPIGTGDPYQPPPPLSGEPPGAEASEAAWRRRVGLLPLPLGEALRQAYAGISPALTRQLLAGRLELQQRPVTELEEADWSWLWQRWQGWLSAVRADRFRFQLSADGSGYRCWTDDDAAEPEAGPAGCEAERSGTAGRQPPLALNRALAAYYGERLTRRRLSQERAELRQRLQSALEREQRQLEQQQQLLEAVPGNAELQQQAHALLSQPDPGREAIDTAQALYRKARKLRRSVAAITPRVALHQQRLEALEASVTFLEQADRLQQLQEIREELEHWLPRANGRGPGPQRGDQPPQPLELRTASGLRLQVGRNHRQNDWISLKRARRGDLWFHAQECPGSHVVLKASEAPATEADLEAAADLAAHFSRARGNTRVPVLMVPVEGLQRLPGAGPGTLRHRGGSVRWGQPARAAAHLAAPNVSGEERP